MTPNGHVEQNATMTVEGNRFEALKHSVWSNGKRRAVSGRRNVSEIHADKVKTCRGNGITRRNWKGGIHKVKDIRELMRTGLRHRVTHPGAKEWGGTGNQWE